MSRNLETYYGPPRIRERRMPKSVSHVRSAGSIRFGQAGRHYGPTVQTVTDCWGLVGAMLRFMGHDDT
jgi:hypothetical protein